MPPVKEADCPLVEWKAGGNSEREERQRQERKNRGRNQDRGDG